MLLLHLWLPDHGLTTIGRHYLETWLHRNYGGHTATRAELGTG